MKEQFTPGPNTEVTPGKEISEYSLQMASSFMPHIVQNKYRDDNVRTLAHMFESARKEARKGYIKYRSLEAAAPEMYEALKGLMGFIQDYGMYDIHGKDITSDAPLLEAEAALSQANSQK